MPEAGRDHPASYVQFAAWSQSDSACLDHLDWPSWPERSRWPECSERGDTIADGRYQCTGCRHHT